MNKALNSDKIREKLNHFLDEYYQVSPSMWAARMGLTHVSLFKFLHGATNPQRRTLGKINAFITRFERDILQRNRPEICAVCGIEPAQTYPINKADGLLQWVCFEHMSKKK